MTNYISEKYILIGRPGIFDKYEIFGLVKVENIKRYLEDFRHQHQYGNKRSIELFFLSTEDFLNVRGPDFRLSWYYCSDVNLYDYSEKIDNTSMSSDTTITLSEVIDKITKYIS